MGGKINHIESLTPADITRIAMHRLGFPNRNAPGPLQKLSSSFREKLELEKKKVKDEYNDKLKRNAEMKNKANRMSSLQSITIPERKKNRLVEVKKALTRHKNTIELLEREMNNFFKVKGIKTIEEFRLPPNRIQIINNLISSGTLNSNTWNTTRNSYVYSAEGGPYMGYRNSTAEKTIKSLMNSKTLNLYNLGELDEEILKLEAQIQSAKSIYNYTAFVEPKKPNNNR